MKITEADIQRFTEGDCWVLANRLHRVAGLPLHTFQYYDQLDIHAFNIFKGKALDVEGLHDIDEFIEAWRIGSNDNGFISDPLKPTDLKDWGPVQFGYHSYRRAIQIADHFIDLFKIDILTDRRIVSE